MLKGNTDSIIDVLQTSFLVGDDVPCTSSLRFDVQDYEKIDVLRTSKPDSLFHNFIVYICITRTYKDFILLFFTIRPIIYARHKQIKVKK